MTVPLDPSFARFRAVIAGATLIMLGLSWRLWVGDWTFPRIPFVVAWPQPGWLGGWGLFVAMVGSILAVLAGRGGRWAWSVSLVCLVGSILGDQNRLQPWVQQYLAVALAAVLLPRERALDLARWYIIVLYAASGLSKLDAAFVGELGGTFLRTVGHLVGLAPEGWLPGVQTAATLAMPAGELVVAVALAVPRLRLWGLAGSVVQHLATVAILGPWALDHSTIVLIWNGAVLVENLVLFGPRTVRFTPGPGAGLVVGALVVALVGFERWGWVDSWPAHALYASHAERSAILWPEAESSELPEAIRRWLGPPDDEGFCRLDLTGWSRAGRGVPVYPQNRVVCGIAESLVERFGSATGPPPRVIFWGRSGVGRIPPRDRVECVGLAAIRRRGGRCWSNAHPAPGSGR